MYLPNAVVILLLVFQIVSSSQDDNKIQAMDDEIISDASDWHRKKSQHRNRQPSNSSRSTSAVADSPLAKMKPSINSIVSQAFLVNLGNANIPPAESVLNALEIAYVQVDKGSSVQGSSIVDKYYVGDNLYIVACLSVMVSKRNSTEPRNLLPRPSALPTTFRRRRRRPFQKPVTAEESAKPSTIRASAIQMVLNGFFLPSCFQVAILPIEASFCKNTNAVSDRRRFRPRHPSKAPSLEQSLPTTSSSPCGERSPILQTSLPVQSPSMTSSTTQLPSKRFSPSSQPSQAPVSNRLRPTIVSSEPVQTPTNQTFRMTMGPSMNPKSWPTVSPSMDPTYKLSIHHSTTPSKWLKSTSSTILPTAKSYEVPSNVPTYAIPTTYHPTATSPSRAPAKLSVYIPAVKPTQLPSVSPTSFPSEIQSPPVSVSISPTTEPMESPSVSLTPSLAFGPPDWFQYGSTISATNNQKISLSRDGLILASVFMKCKDEAPCARVFEFKTVSINETTSITDWHQVGSDIFAEGSSTVNSVAVSGGSTIAVGATSPSGDFEKRHFSLQTYLLEGIDWRPLGELLEESLPYHEEYRARLHLTSDGLFMSFGISTNANGGKFLFQSYKRARNSWRRFERAALVLDEWASAEISGDGKTIALQLLDTGLSLIYHLTDAGEWEKMTNGLRRGRFHRMSLNEDGTVMATRRLIEKSIVDIYQRNMSGTWEHRGKVTSNSIYESNFGYEIDLSSDGRTVAIASFIGKPTIATCTQAFQLDDNSKWRPMGRPPCSEQTNLHNAFGAYLALSSDGQRMIVGDYGPSGHSSDSGHLHAYAFQPNGL